MGVGWRGEPERERKGEGKEGGRREGMGRGIIFFKKVVIKTTDFAAFPPRGQCSPLHWACQQGQERQLQLSDAVTCLQEGSIEQDVIVAHTSTGESVEDRSQRPGVTVVNDCYPSTQKAGAEGS